MSIKSLLQIILILLIFIIIGGIYFVYFYTGPLKKDEIIRKELNLDEYNNETKLSANQEILEGINSNQNNELEDNNKLSNINLDKSKLPKNTKKSEKVSIDESTGKNLENVTRDIEYITTNKNGEVLKIIAKYGKTNLEDTNILDLVDVDGSIVSNERSNIYISSNYAEYNYSNQNSKFYDNVIINYENKIIKCDNLDLYIKDNIAVGYNNVTVEDDNSFMKAKKITMNMLTKDISINSDEDIEITTN